MEATEGTNLERIREYGQELEQDPDTLAFVRLADAFREEGMLSAAADICRQGLERHPDYVSAHIVMGEVLEAQGDVEHALESYNTAVRLDPQNVVARTGLGRLLLRLSRTEEARLQLEYALFMSPGHQEAEELLEAAAGKRALPDTARPTAGSALLQERGAAATATTAGLESGLALVMGVAGVAGAMVLGQDGLTIACELSVSVGEDTLGALIAEIYAGTRRYVERLDMGALRRVLIEGAAGKMIIAGGDSCILLVATEQTAKLGLVNRQIDRALTLMAEA